MRKLALFAAATLLVAAPALAEDWDFILVNNSGKPVKGIDISEAGAGKWVANKVDPEAKREALLRQGARTTVHFDKGSGCKYDVKATFDDDTSAVWSGINVCDNAYVTIRTENGQPRYTAS